MLRGHTVKRSETLVFVTLTAALLACGGTKGWSERPVKVPTRSLSVDESELFSSDSGCSPALEIEVGAECAKECGPIGVFRGSERVATLLAQPSTAPPPVPERMRPAYTQPGKDANRKSLHLPLMLDGDAIELKSNCHAELASQREGTSRNGSRLTIDAAQTRACRTISAEVECR